MCLSFGMRLTTFVTVVMHTFHIVDVTPEIIDESFSFRSAFRVSIPAHRDTAGFADTAAEVLNAYSFTHEVISFRCTVDEVNEALSNWGRLVFFGTGNNSKS